MNYLISNIKINNGEQFEAKLPIEYQESGYLAKIYLRTYCLNMCDVSYDVKQTNHIFDTSVEMKQPYDINILDAATAGFREYKDCCKILVKPACLDSIHLHITDEEIEDSGSLDQAVYEQLLHKLPIEFYYTEIHVNNSKKHAISRKLIEILTDNLLIDDASAPNAIGDIVYKTFEAELGEDKAEELSNLIESLASNLVADIGKYM